MGKHQHAAVPSVFRGEGDLRDVCTCGHERDLHLTHECVGCSDSFGCRGFTLRPPIDRAAMIARIGADLSTLSDIDLERAERAVARLARRLGALYG